jgi:hypothetical protein
LQGEGARFGGDEAKPMLQNERTGWFCFDREASKNLDKFPAAASPFAACSDGVHT